MPGTTLPAATVTFQWRSNGASIGEWWLYLGSTLGGRDILDTGSVGASTSRTVSGLRTDGRTVHARLWYRQVGMGFSVDFVFTAATIGTPGTPAVTSPTPGSTLPGASATFVWTANGAPVSQWWVQLGTTSGASNIFDSGNLGSATTITVTNLPTGGNPVYLKLWYLLSGTWQSTVFQYATLNASPTIQSPVPGSTFSGTNVTFIWQAPEGQTVADYLLYLGTSVGASDLYNSGSLGLNRSRVVSTLPVNGSTVYVRLWYKIFGRWEFTDFQYTASLP